MFIRDLANFKQRIYRQNDAKNKNLARNKKCRFCDFIGSTMIAHVHEVHAPHENESDLHPFLSYLIQLQESVKRYLFNELPLERTDAVESDYQFTTECPFCFKNFGKGMKKVRQHAHVSGDYSNGYEVKHYEAGQYICTFCSKCNLQLSFNKNYKLPVYFHNGSHYDFTFIMKLIASYA